MFAYQPCCFVWYELATKRTMRVVLLPMAVSKIFAGMTEQERDFVRDYAQRGDAEGAKKLAGYVDPTSAHYLLRKPHVAMAVRAEIIRLMATEGAQIGFRSLKRIAKDESLPAAAQVAAAKALLQGAGLLDAPTDQKESKSINDMTRDELRQYIEGRRDEIDKMEARLADGARDITPKANAQAPDFLE